MATAIRLTLDQVLALEETKPYREFVRGEIVEKPMPGQDHSDIVFALNGLLFQYLQRTGEGEGETELRHADRGEDRAYLPDLGVTLHRDPNNRGPLERPPDFAVEVLSPDDRASYVVDKVNFYLRAGVSVVWVVDPDRETVTVYRPGQSPQEQRSPGVVTAAPALRDFRVELAELFSVLHPRADAGPSDAATSP